MIRRAVVPLGFACLLIPVPAAQLTDLQPGRNFVSSAEFGAGRSTAIDVGDCDNDGDLDVVVGNGNDGTPQANRIYINLGGLQAGVPGTFADETATRFAGILDDKGRDCEFVDIDQDGDLDIQVSNDTKASDGGAPNRFYQNRGGLQEGTIGFYTEITDTAYGQLVSVSPADQVLGGNQGPFRDFCCDCDFADLDDDGDMDMFHSSYGPGISGTRNSLVFLNDGAGVFDELWPWADPAADIQTHTFDMDLVDLDGDFDIDVIMSSRNSQARIYVNNLFVPTGGTPFTDVTQSALIDTGAVTFGNSNYDVECTDLDGDGDFDAWMNEYSGFAERILENRGVHGGAPRFVLHSDWIKADPIQSEENVDYLDFDGDGDLDPITPNFSGVNHLYQSGLAQGLDPAVQGLYHRTEGAGSLAVAFPELPSTGNGGQTMDGDTGDMDGDGDDDVVIANDANQQNRYYENILGIPDAHSPTFHAVTVQGDKPLGADAVIHAAVRDNSSMPIFVFYETVLVYSVDGGPDVVAPMRAQGSQQFRGQIPGDVEGEIAYRVECTDRAGNTGISATHAFVQGSPDAWTDLGSGLAGAADVPALVGTGTLAPGSSGGLTLSGAAASAAATLFVSLASTPTPFKGGILVPVPPVLTLPLVTNGSGSIPLAWASWPGGLPSATSIFVQYAVADAGAPAGVALSNALEGVTP
jgi:hypothetical protein